MTVFIVAGLAAANTSAGAPWTICWARVALEPKLNRTVVPGWAASKVLPSSVKVPVSDAAANTVNVLVPAAAAEAEAEVAGVAGSLEPQPDRPRPGQERAGP